MCGLLCLCAFTTNAQQVVAVADNSPFEFIENKGQWAQDFLYQADMGGGMVYLRRNSFVFFL
ncbi:MAG TPA: hypothetical protein VGC22_09265, partial [Chitinophaga sp.]